MDYICSKRWQQLPLETQTGKLYDVCHLNKSNELNGCGVWTRVVIDVEGLQSNKYEDSLTFNSEFDCA